MADFTYDPGLVIDDETGAPVPNQAGELRATADGPAVDVYDLLGTPVTGLETNDAGVVRRFSADISTGYLNFGGVSQFVASDQQQNALSAATAAATQATNAAGAAATASTAATAAQAAAEAAAGAATAPVDSAVDAGIVRAATAGTVLTPTQFEADAQDTGTVVGAAIADAAAEAADTGPRYSSIQQSGSTPVTQRALLEFVGATVTDDPVTGATKVDVSTLPDFRVDLAADQSLTQSSTTVQTITGFSVPMGLNDVWLIKFCIGYRAATNAGFKLQNTVSSGAAFDNFGTWIGIVSGNVGTTPDTAALKHESVGNQVARDFGAMGTGTTATISGEMRVRCTAAGSFLFRAAQTTAQASAITVMAKSWLVAVRVA